MKYTIDTKMQLYNFLMHMCVHNNNLYYVLEEEIIKKNPEWDLCILLYIILLCTKKIYIYLYMHRNDIAAMLYIYIVL